MRKSRTNFAWLCVLALASCGGSPQVEEVAGAPQALPSGVTVSQGVIPYTLEYEPQTVPSPDQFPALQSYSIATLDDGSWFVVGGRHNVGLHTFTTAPGHANFPPKNQNQYLWYIQPETPSAVQVLDLTKLDPSVGDPLMSTNQQYYYDSPSGNWYIMGGYGLDTKAGKMRTFHTLIMIPLTDVVKIVRDGSLSADQKQQAIAKTIQVATNDLFAVTGGVMRRTESGYFVVVFGQLFDGEYNPFAGSPDFNQVYTEAVRYFTLKPGTLELVQHGSLTSSDTDDPYHRRDLPVVNDVDPNTGANRIAAFGGVFPPGMIAGYTYPVYVTESFGQLQAAPDRSATQHFSQYECPTVVVYDSAGKVTYHTFFGGIGHYYLFQDSNQKSIYDEATQQGRNDGLPFVADITTFLQRADGSYDEYIAPAPIPGYKLHGASVEFIPNATLGGGKFRANDVIDLQSFSQGERAMIGYVYGGIEAAAPLPAVPNTGTQGTNALYKVYLTRTPWDGIPWNQGHEAKGNFNHHPSQ